MLDAHMQRFAFSPLGALRWRRDLQEYGAAVARLRSPKAQQHLEDMQVGGWGAGALAAGPGS